MTYAPIAGDGWLELQAAAHDLRHGLAEAAGHHPQRRTAGHQDDERGQLARLRHLAIFARLLQPLWRRGFCPFLIAFFSHP